MAKTIQVKKHFTFVAGLNTEAGPLTFPDNSWSDGDNVIPDIDGSINSRTCMDFEPSYVKAGATFTATAAANGAFVTGYWNNVAGDGDRNFVVVQKNSLVEFYLNTGSGAVSANLKGFTINLSTYKVANEAPAGFSPIECVSTNGNLIIVSRDTEPLLVEYSAAADTITVSTIAIQIRDFLGVDDGLRIDERPAADTAAHRYNLYNQGWNATNVAAYFSSASLYPSSAQSWTAGKDSSDNFSAALLDKQDFGTSPAPKGRYVLDLFSRDRATASSIPGIAVETESYRPTTCAFMAGRAWYAGIRSTTVGSWVLFSQVAETNQNLGKCYQDADPTSEIISDLVASDGGVIPIQDAGVIVKLVPLTNAMIVIADNGVWQVVGGGVENGFAADSYEVRKLSSVGCISTKSIVQTPQGVLFWGEGGIFAIQSTDLGGLEVASVSAATIQSLYEDIPANGKVFCSAVYDSDNLIVYWAYNNDDDQDGVQNRFKKNRLLCLDLRLKAFYTLSIESLASLSPYITDIFTTKTKGTQTETYQVVVGADDIVAGADDIVVSYELGALSPIRIKFLTLCTSDGVTYKTTVSQFDEDNVAPRKFRDWYSENNTGVNYHAYLIPGYDMGGGQGGDKFIGALYVTVFLKRTETGVDSNGDAINPSSCSMRGRWDWSDSTAGNRWSESQEVYRHLRPWLPTVPSSTYDDGYPVIVTKNKVRGRGRTLQLWFHNAPDKDMRLLGWAITYLGNSNV